MDPSTFKACFEATRAPLLAYLTRVSGNPTLSEDLLQEAYIRLLNAPPRDFGAESLRSWLLTTSTRLLRDHWRQNRRWAWWPWAPDRGDADPFPEPASLDPPPDQQAQERQLVALGFSALTPRQRSLLWLSHVEGLDHAEISRALGLRVGSVKVLLHRARQRMLRALSDLETPPSGGRP